MPTSIPLHVVPAYGADYKTEADALAAWKSGTDFLIRNISSPWDGAYCSCRDFTRAESILIRYHHRTKSVITGGLKKPKRASTLAALLFAASFATSAYATPPEGNYSFTQPHAPLTPSQQYCIKAGVRAHWIQAMSAPASAKPTETQISQAYIRIYVDCGTHNWDDASKLTLTYLHQLSATLHSGVLP